MAHFWKIMNYQCSDCGETLQMYLEDGCEGPQDVEVSFAYDGREFIVHRTKAGRMVQPVPFGIRCACGKSKTHVWWQKDQPVDVTIDGRGAGFPHFRYDDSADPHACGIPRNHLA